MIQKTRNSRLYFFILLGLGMAGCFQPAIPIRMRDSYPIDVFYEGQSVDRSYTEIRLVVISEEIPLTNREKTAGGRMLYRGNDMQQKDLLVAKLVVDAQKLGADALINVKYQVYTNEKVTGYSMEGLAVKYRGE
ncbi:MAG: hypothetical protein LH606_16530 [Cytophagaceae bacterium]|nr:hypothetical protein [Cytophagaceae bacterium]